MPVCQNWFDWVGSSASSQWPTTIEPAGRMPDDLDDFARRAATAEYVESANAKLVHLLRLVRNQRARFEQQVVGRANFAYVVQQGRHFEQFALARVHLDSKTP